MKVTYLGHAAMIVETGGTRILMDPWLTDPTYHGTWWHYPPLRIGIRDLPPIDYLYISHEHPDHFDPPTLAKLDKNIRVIIPNFKRKRFRERIERVGFHHIQEYPFGEDFKLNGSGLTCRLIAPDRAWDDSAILVRDGKTTVLNVNDCHLDDATLQALGKAFPIDLAFLTFTGASQYPGCFDFPIGSKAERAIANKRAHLEEFVNWAVQLNTKRAVPAAGNHALLAADQLFLNTPNYVNTPADAVAELATHAPHIQGLQMNPGDTWSPAEGHVQAAAPPNWSRRMEEIEELSHAMQGRITEYFASEPQPPQNLFDEFETYFNGLLTADPTAAPRVGIVTWWVVTGPQGGHWTIDFTRDRNWVQKGGPEKWNLRMTIPDTLVAKGIRGQGNWEDLVLSFRVRLSRRPDRYMKDFWTWFCKI